MGGVSRIVGNGYGNGRYRRRKENEDIYTDLETCCLMQEEGQIAG